MGTPYILPDPNEHPADQPQEPPELFGTRAKIITGALILAALLVPTSWVDRAVQLFPRAERTDAVFTDDTARLDAALARGDALLAADPAKVRRLRVALQLRRIVQAGPMTGGDVAEAKKLLRDLNAAVDADPTESGKRALRAHQADTLAQRFPRQDAAKLRDALLTLDAQLAPHLRAAPTTPATAPKP